MATIAPPTPTDETYRHPEDSAPKGYKWIADRIESLDPETDYEEIWRLSTTYYVNDFMFNFVYTTGFPHFTLPPHGVEIIWREGKGKLIAPRSYHRRADETLNHFWRWFEMGPSSLITKHSVEQVNRIHAGIGKKYPGAFSHQDDFIYTMCWIGADMHRLRLRIGLPGFTDTQQRAIAKFWGLMSKFFVSEDGPLTEPFPKTFDGMLQYMADYEAVEWETHPGGVPMCEALMDQFADRWFPKPLRFAGRRMILSLWDEPVRRVHKVPTPSKLEQRFFGFGLKLVLLAKERVLPDPKISTPERNRRKARTGKASTAA